MNGSPLPLSVDRRRNRDTGKSVTCWVEVGEAASLFPSATEELPPALGGCEWRIHLPRVPLWDLPHTEESCLPPVPALLRAPTTLFQGLTDTGQEGQALSPNSGHVWRATPAPELPEMGRTEALGAAEMQFDFPLPSPLLPLPAGIDPGICLHPSLSQSLLPGEMTYDTCPKSKS